MLSIQFGEIDNVLPLLRLLKDVSVLEQAVEQVINRSAKLHAVKPIKKILGQFPKQTENAVREVARFGGPALKFIEEHSNNRIDRESLMLFCAPWLGENGQFEEAEKAFRIGGGVVPEKFQVFKVLIEKIDKGRIRTLPRYQKFPWWVCDRRVRIGDLEGAERLVKVSAANNADTAAKMYVLIGNAYMKRGDIKNTRRIAVLAERVARTRSPIDFRLDAKLNEAYLHACGKNFSAAKKALKYYNLKIGKAGRSRDREYFHSARLVGIDLAQGREADAMTYVKNLKFTDASNNWHPFGTLGAEFARWGKLELLSTWAGKLKEPRQIAVRLGAAGELLRLTQQAKKNAGN